VYITSCGQDTLRDDARLMRDALKQEGVQVRYDEFDGYPHYFWTFPGPSLEQPARDYLKKLGNGVKFVLSSSANM
jgi:versiconal hemiacetal acetate esterase